MSKITLFSAQTTDGNSQPFNAIGGGQPSDKYLSFLTIFGTFDGASVELQYLASDGNYYSTGDDPFASPAAYFADLNINTSYRLALTGAGASTSISADVYNASAA